MLSLSGGNNYPVWRWERPKSEVELGNLLEDFFSYGGDAWL